MLAIELQNQVEFGSGIPAIDFEMTEIDLVTGAYSEVGTSANDHADDAVFNLGEVMDKRIEERTVEEVERDLG